MALPPELTDALHELASAATLLVASDFDGVLAPLVLDPLESRPLPGTIESLTGLAALPETYAAVVSGRDLETLTLLTGLADSAVSRIGSHGAEFSGDAAASMTPEQEQRLASLVEDVKDLRAALPDIRLEPKPTAVVVHTRGMDEASAASAEAAALEVAARHTGLHVLHGKHVVEMSVVQADKGTALMGLRDAVGAVAVAYFGDDVTDEHVFTRLAEPDVGVKVGAGDTAAGFRVAAPEDAAQALALLLQLRSAGSLTFASKG